VTGVALISTTAAVSTVTSSGFASSDGSVTFALNIPQSDTSNDLYFTISGPSSQSWIVRMPHSSQQSYADAFLGDWHGQQQDG
jgi:hypothetical protein